MVFTEFVVDAVISMEFDFDVELSIVSFARKKKSNSCIYSLTFTGCIGFISA